MPEWPADQVERRPVAALVPYARNARTHSPAQIDQLAASIEQWGWTTPVLVDESGTLIAGHGRVMAAKQLGIAEVPVMVARGWSEAQTRAYVLADNQLAANAGWDEDLLRFELAELQSGGFHLDTIGFSADAIAGLLLPNEGQTDPDEVPEPEAVAVSRPGEVWLLGRHRLACGSSTDPATVAAVLAGTKPHLMVTDPPYGVKYDPSWRAKAGINHNQGKMGEVLNDDRADWREAWALFPGDVVYVWHSGLFAPIVAASIEACGFALRSQIIWAKDRFALSRGHYHWQHEPCWYAVRNAGQWAGDRSQSSLWNIKARENAGVGHSTQKPVECMRRPIENSSKPGDAVYEPFSGSGTTIIAAEMTGRTCLAIELSPIYVDVAIRRWEGFAAASATLEGDGRTFAEIAAERMARAAA